MQFAATETAKKAVLDEIESRPDSEKGEEEEANDAVKVPVVRMMFGEVGEATSVAVLPVCRAEEKGQDVLEAPSECETQGDFGVVVAEKGWKRWVVLPRWEPLVGLGKGGVAIAFSDARALPWKVNRWYKEEAILVVADRRRKEVAADEGFYLVAVDDGGRSNGLKVERGSDLIEKGVKESLGAVVLVVRPPRDDTDDQITEEEWE